MQTVREYGPAPRRVLVLHGGPGCAGEVAPVAEELARRGFGVVEPFQTADSVAGQVAELAGVIGAVCAPPVVLVGWSWGAWLALWAAAAHPGLVSRLILVGSGPFEERHAQAIRDRRAGRLTEQEAREVKALMHEMSDPQVQERVMALFDKMDGFAPLDTPHPPVVYDAALHRKVWAEASALRVSGALVDGLADVRCPVLAVHGAHDPHPAEGVRGPLMARVPGAEFTLLDACGHKPWHERHARAAFFDLLEDAIRQEVSVGLGS